MDTSTSIITSIGVGTILFLVSYYLTRFIGASSSTDSKSEKQREEKETVVDKKNVKIIAIENKYPAGKLFIYFGSQTGTAEGFAKVLQDEGKNSGFDAKTIDLEDFDPEHLKSAKLALFIMATYGEGEPTDNAVNFTKWLKDSQSEDDASNSLSQLRYSVFGLGNRQYEHFNKTGKVTDTGLTNLGAVRMFEYGEGDDDANLEVDFDHWKKKLWPSLVEQFHPKSALDGTTKTESMEQKAVKLSFEVIVVGKEGSETAAAHLKAKKIISSKNMQSSTKHFFTAAKVRLVTHRELKNLGHASSKDPIEVGSTRHIEVSLKESGLTYFTADNLAILPENDMKNVTALSQQQGYHLDEVIDLKPTELPVEEFKYPFPCPCSVKDVLSQYLDIQGAVKHSTLERLIPYTTNDQQREWLHHILLAENRNQFKALVEDQGKSICDLLCNELNSCQIPLSDLLHLVSFIQPRYYTISSSSSCYPDVVHITVSITQYLLKNQSVFTGLCSGYLQRLDEASTCRIFVRPSTFRLPSLLTTPIIMIGPGTGIAPMRALLQERSHQCLVHNIPASSVENILYFGCKHENEDFIYKEELLEFKKKGILTQLHTAFSRDLPGKKVYVQDIMRRPENSVELARLIHEEGAHVYVCGATLMGHDVMDAFVAILTRERGLSQEAATGYIKSLQDSSRYVQELWST